VSEEAALGAVWFFFEFFYEEGHEGMEVGCFAFEHFKQKRPADDAGGVRGRRGEITAGWAR
jgi:hypothetical protein